MSFQIEKQIRKTLAKLLPSYFYYLYTTLDDPIKVPVQEAAYQLAVNKYIQIGDKVLDVGFGLGYGLELISIKTKQLYGIEIDRRAIQKFFSLNTSLVGFCEIQKFDGKNIPYPNDFFDVVTCIDVIEHVPHYIYLLTDMIRVTKRVVLLSTPNRRPEITRKNGRPRNPWHIREWSYEELNTILVRLKQIRIEWNYLEQSTVNGIFNSVSNMSEKTMALTPALIKKDL